MESTIIKQALQPLKVTAFYNDNGYYKIDKTNLDILYQQVDTVLNRLINDISEDDSRHHDMQAIIDTFKQSMQDYRDMINQLAIPEHDFMEYLQNKKPTDMIQDYLDAKQLFQNSAVPIFYFYEKNAWRSASSDAPKAEDEAKDYSAQNVPVSNDNTRKVLNHNNPFADISIENEAFLYPTDNGDFQTLVFSLGHQMTKITENDQSIVALQPNFKIKKTNERQNLTTSIAMDDTLTTPMPKQNGKKALLYI